MKVLCTCHRRRRAKGRKKHRGKSKWLLLFMLRYCYHVWPLLLFVVCLFAGLLVCLFVCSLVCFLLLAVAVVVVMVWFAVSSQSSNELCKSRWKNMWHFRTNDTARSTERTPPASKLDSWRPSKASEDSTATAVISAPETNQGSRLGFALPPCPLSVFRFQAWTLRAKQGMAPRKTAKQQWTTMNYEKFELIDSHWTYCDQNKILQVLATSRKNAHKPSKPSDQLLSLSWKLAHWKHISISLKSLKSIIVPGSDGGSPELWLQH